MSLMPCPYEDLYIYAVEGRVNSCDEDLLGGAFLGNWVEEGSSFLFFTQPADDAVGSLVQRRPSLTISDRFHFRYDEWQGEGFGRIEEGGIVIRAPWLAREGGPLGDILLDPGVVFGNGLHPTTRDCLRAIRALSGIVPFRSVLDLGTGTGILALYAAALGAESVLAVDLNPLCVRTASRNIALNRLSGVVEAVEGSAERFCQEPFDLVVANIHAEVIKGLVAVDAFLENPAIVISGLLRTPFREIRDRVSAGGYDIWKVYEHEMTWYTLAAIRRNPQ